MQQNNPANGIPPAVHLQVVKEIGKDVLTTMFTVLKEEKENRRRTAPTYSSQESVDPPGFDAPAYVLEFLEHYRTPAPGGGAAKTIQKEANNKKKKKAKKSQAVPGSSGTEQPVPKKYPSVDDRFFSTS